jgi:hypothetical protein
VLTELDLITGRQFHFRRERSHRLRGGCTSFVRTSWTGVETVAALATD